MLLLERLDPRFVEVLLLPSEILPEVQEDASLPVLEQELVPADLVDASVEREAGRRREIPRKPIGPRSLEPIGGSRGRRIAEATREGAALRARKERGGQREEDPLLLSEMSVHGIAEAIEAQRGDASPTLGRPEERADLSTDHLVIIPEDGRGPQLPAEEALAEGVQGDILAPLVDSQGFRKGAQGVPHGRAVGLIRDRGPRTGQALPKQCMFRDEDAERVRG